MSRRHSADKREINPDPKYGNLVVSKFMNSIMRAGKKSVAERIVYGALDLIEGRTKQNPVSVFEQALDNVMDAIACWIEAAEEDGRPVPAPMGADAA